MAGHGGVDGGFRVLLVTSNPAPCFLFEALRTARDRPRALGRVPAATPGAGALLWEADAAREGARRGLE
jgi:hypothetical protein